MEIVFNIILPVFGTLGLGYCAARFGLFDESANRGLSLFVFNIAIPLMLFRALALTKLPDQIPWGYVLSYYGGTFAAWGLGIFVGRHLFKRNLSELGIIAMGSSFSNTSMLGIPLIITAFGQQAALPLFVIISCHSLILLPPTTIIIEFGQGRHDPVKTILMRLMKNISTTPLFWGLAVGILTSISGFGIPESIDSVAKNIGTAAVPCALFSLGASLTCYRVSGNILESLAIVTIKNLIHPVFVWLLVTYLFEVPDFWAKVAVSIAALPAGVMTYIFAQRYQVCQATSATAVFISTTISVLTLSALFFLFSVK
jgi:predicted permease